MSKKEEKIIKEATKEDERLQMSVRHNLADPVKVRNKTYNVRWMHPYTEDRITQLMLEDGNDSKVLCQCAALIVLGGFWKSKFLYWYLWRWFYYIRQYNASELSELFETAQKKTVPKKQFRKNRFLSIIVKLFTIREKSVDIFPDRRIIRDRKGNGVFE